MNDQLLKVQDVMKRLNVSRRTVYYWIDEGILKTVRIGGIYRFHPEDIHDLIESGRSALTGKFKKILAVDDDILVRESIKILLGRAGYSVTVTASGREAVELLERQDFDLTLTDMRMPGMDGLETLTAMRKVRKAAGKEMIPEIIISAYDDHAAVNRARKFGVKDFIIKPFELDDFLKVIEKNIV